MIAINETHDPKLTSWVESANVDGTEFPIQNLPFGVFRRGASEHARCGVAIGDQVVDLKALHDARALKGSVADVLAACSGSILNPLMALGHDAAGALRKALSEMLRTGVSQAKDIREALTSQTKIQMALPATIGDYTDFYTSIHHATAIGKLFRPDNPLLPNYKWVPIGYHGRASSIGVSGQSFHRPQGQLSPPNAQGPTLGASRRLDFELEVGIFIGKGNALGTPITIDSAEEHVFGLCLLNDWSARDIQTWEYQPLGPFLAKNFASTISPWIVTLEALAPFRSAWTRPAQDPQPLPYLDGADLRTNGAIDMTLIAELETAQMRGRGQGAHTLSRSNFRYSYWSVSQMVAHHTINGCNLQPGDLLGSGTQSGPDASEAGSLIELTSNGKQPLSLGSGETRTFLEDGDRITLRASCERDEYRRIGFGEASGTVLPVVSTPA